MQFDPNAVPGHSRQITVGHIFGGQISLMPQAVCVSLLDLRGRPHQGLVPVSVDDHGFAAFNIAKRPLCLAEDRTREGPCYDRHVGQGLANFQDDAAQMFAIVIQQLGRAHGSGDNNRVLGQNFVRIAARVSHHDPDQPVR